MLTMDGEDVSSQPVPGEKPVMKRSFTADENAEMFDALHAAQAEGPLKALAFLLHRMQTMQLRM